VRFDSSTVGCISGQPIGRSRLNAQTWIAIMNDLLLALEILLVVAGIALVPGQPKLRIYRAPGFFRKSDTTNGFDNVNSSDA
jgi:hypothetical protein